MKAKEYAPLILFLIVVGVVLFYLSPFLNRLPQALATTNKAVSATAAPASTVTGEPSISAQYIENVLCTAHSPACGTGLDLYTYGKQYGIDPVYALAFFQHESTFGTAGVARETLNLGNIRCSKGYTCIEGFRAYPTWKAGYEDWYKLISWYVTSLHKTTVRDILYTYAPPADHNDTEGYIRAVCTAVNAWRAEAEKM